MRVLFIGLITIILSSCHFLGMGERVTGNGKIVTQQKDAGNFSSVEVSGSVAVHVKQATANAVKIETDENLMPYIEVFTSNDKLVIRTKKGYNLDPSEDIIVYVAAPVFKDIDISGACDIIGDGIITGNKELIMHVSGSGAINMEVDLPKISTNISGSGSVNLKGRATDFDASVSGSGDIKCFDLVTENTSLDLSGSTDAEVNVNKKLDVQVSGSGDVQYKGAANVNQKISGSGSVKKVG